MKYYSKFINWVLWKIVLLLKKRTYIIYTGGTKYLLRVYIKHKGFFPEILLHRFYASDSDRDLHDHPWKIARSLILSGSYKETRLKEDKKTKYYKIYKPGNINKIRANDFHQVTMLEEPIWTLFIAGKRIKKWGFWSIEQQQFIPWDQYVELNNNVIKDLDGNITKLPE